MPLSLEVDKADRVIHARHLKRYSEWGRGALGALGLVALGKWLGLGAGGKNKKAEQRVVEREHFSSRKGGLSTSLDNTTDCQVGDAVQKKTLRNPAVRQERSRVLDPRGLPGPALHPSRQSARLVCASSSFSPKNLCLALASALEQQSSAATEAAR